MTSVCCGRRGGWRRKSSLVCSLILDYHHQVPEKNDSALRGQPLETPLEPRIAKFISLICNISMMKQHMMEIGYNADKLPLGKLVLLCIWLQNI
ncbi:hypothetical protein GBA52_028858 [Prunus armeniaca]|nr:hypothetical protein GBA52_028858 [Prunus armeniaca]